MQPLKMSHVWIQLKKESKNIVYCDMYTVTGSGGL